VISFCLSEQILQKERVCRSDELDRIQSEVVLTTSWTDISIRFVGGWRQSDRFVYPICGSRYVDPKRGGSDKLQNPKRGGSDDKLDRYFYPICGWRQSDRFVYPICGSRYVDPKRGGSNKLDRFVYPIFGSRFVFRHLDPDV